MRPYFSTFVKTLWHGTADCDIMLALRVKAHMKDSHYYENITDAIPCGGYKVAVRFRKGECGVFDCTRYFDDPFWASLGFAEDYAAWKKEYDATVAMYKVR